MEFNPCCIHPLPSSQSQELEKSPEVKPKVRQKTALVETFHANFQLKPHPENPGKHKLEIIKINKEEMTEPPEGENSRLFGWLVEVRLRATGKHFDRFYYHIGKRGKYRSVSEVINYILHGPKERVPDDQNDSNEKASKRGRPRKMQKIEENKVAQVSNPTELPNDGDENEKDKEVVGSQLQKNDSLPEKSNGPLPPGNNGRCFCSCRCWCHNNLGNFRGRFIWNNALNPLNKWDFIGSQGPGLSRKRGLFENNNTTNYYFNNNNNLNPPLNLGLLGMRQRSGNEFLQNKSSLFGNNYYNRNYDYTKKRPWNWSTMGVMNNRPNMMSNLGGKRKEFESEGVSLQKSQPLLLLGGSPNAPLGLQVRRQPESTTRRCSQQNSFSKDVIISAAARLHGGGDGGVLGVTITGGGDELPLNQTSLTALTYDNVGTAIGSLQHEPPPPPLVNNNYEGLQTGNDRAMHGGGAVHGLTTTGGGDELPLNQTSLAALINNNVGIATESLQHVPPPLFENNNNEGCTNEDIPSQNETQDSVMRHTNDDTTMNTNDSSPVLFEYTSLDIVDVEAVWAFLYEDGEASVTVNEQDEETRGESEYERELERTFEDIIENQPILGSSFDNFLLDGSI